MYQYTDHLGNVRLSYTQDPADGGLEVVEENNYYPFGLKHRGYNTLTSALGNDAAQRWKFGGKEYQADMDLAWYDVSARNYDPALGRWMNLDPLAEQMRRHSPYNYAFDNPVFFIDPDGMSPVVGSNGYTDITEDEASMYGIHVSGGGGTVDITNLNTGKVVTMSSSDYNEVVMANRSGVTTGNNGGGGSSDGECKTGDCFEAYFRVQAQMIQAELNAMNPVKAVKEGLVDGAKNILSDTWDSVVQQFERAIDDPIGEWQKGFDSSGGVSGIIGGGPYQLYRTLKGSYDFGYNTATTLLNGDPYGAGYAVGNYYSGAALGGLATLGANGLYGLRSGGMTHVQYRNHYWSTGNRKKPPVQFIFGPEGQVFKNYMELHHRFIPHRAKWAPNWLKHNRFNMQPLRSLDHGLVDPFRYRFFPKWMKAQYPK